MNGLNISDAEAGKFSGIQGISREISDDSDGRILLDGCEDLLVDFFIHDGFGKAE